MAPEDGSHEQRFPAQSQERPGSTTRMRPRPHDRMEGYVGSGRLEGRAALITGGDSGIGRAVAVAFAKEGADVAIAYLSEDEDAQETADLVRHAGRRALLLPGDLTVEADCERAGAVRHPGADAGGGPARRHRPPYVFFASESFSGYYSGEVLAPIGGEILPA